MLFSLHREILKLMCEEKCMTEALEKKRNDFVKDLQDMRVNFEVCHDGQLLLHS